MSASVFASRATIGARYVTKGGWPVTIREIGAQVIVKNDLTGETHRLDKGQLLWPYNERLISKEAITMARAKGHKKMPAGHKAALKANRTHARAPKKLAEVVAGKLNRIYQGKPHIVEPTDGGYLYNGETFTSLTAVAKKITGYPSISGPAFFKTAQPAQPAAQPDPALAPAL